MIIVLFWVAKIQTIYIYTNTQAGRFGMGMDVLSGCLETRPTALAFLAGR